MGAANLAGAEHKGFPPGEFVAHLKTRLSAVWQGQSLGVVLDRLAAAHGIVFWVDRRVDLQQSVDSALQSHATQRGPQPTY